MLGMIVWAAYLVVLNRRDAPAINVLLVIAPPAYCAPGKYLRTLSRFAFRRVC